MITIQRINSSHEHYPFMEKLMETAFPLQERRNADQQRENADNNHRFHNNILLENGTPIGLLTYWDFESFLYIEHFAISSDIRNKGYGQMALNILKDMWNGMIVLEVEEPTDELTRRRIGFYERQGFVLQPHSYLQPPYRDGDEWFPMKLMTLGTPHIPLETHEKIKQTIYQEVYGKTS